nr:hypothetical protein 7 [Bacillaceae bacterium]
MSLAKHLIDMFKSMGNDNELWRLLYYKGNPLDPNLTEVKLRSDYVSVIEPQERIIRSPKTDGLSNTPICRICMYLGNRTPSSNQKYPDQDIHFDIYAHIDEYDKNDARALMICDRIDELIGAKRITGIGKVEPRRFYIIGNAPSGYIGYKVVYTFGSEEK